MDKKLLLILILVLFLTTACSNKDIGMEIKPKGKDESMDSLETWLNNNYSRLGLGEEDIRNLEILNDDIVDKKIVLTGEYHGVKDSYQVEKEFIKYLKEEKDLKYLLEEVGYSESYLVNKYLESGNIEMLKDIMRGSIGVNLSGNEDKFKFYQWLHEYNMSLAREDRILVLGIDIEHGIEKAIYVLKDLLAKEEPPAEIEEYINSFKNKSFRYTSSFMENYQENIDIYQEYLKDNFFEFNLIVENIHYTMTCDYESMGYETEEDGKTRDDQMYDNFLKLDEEFKGEFYYGQLGAFHITKKSIYEETIASLLNKNEDFKDKILIIYPFYDNSSFFDLTDREDFTSKIEMSTYGEEGSAFYKLKDVHDKIEGDTAIYKIKGKDSPFKGEKFIGTDHEITDILDYIIVISNSEASEILNLNKFH